MKKYRYADGVLALSLATYAASATIVPVAMLKLMESLDFNLIDGGALETGRGLLLFLCLFLSGGLARRFGMALVLCVGALLLALSGLMFFFSGSYALLLLSMMVAGLGGGLLEALVTPMIVVLHPEDDGSMVNRMHGYFSVGVAVTVLGSGLLLSINFPWKWLFALLLLPTLLTAWGFARIHRQRLERPRPAAALPHLSVLRTPAFWYFGLALACGGAAESAVNYWNPTLIQLRYQVAPFFGGLGTAVFAVGMGIGRLKGYLLIRRMGLRRQLRYSAWVGAAVGLLFFWLPSVWLMLPALFLAGLASACFWPSIQALAIQRIPGDSTFIFIALSCCGMLGYAVTPPLLGWIGDRTSLAMAFLTLPFFFLGVVFFLWLCQRWEGRKG